MTTLRHGHARNRSPKSREYNTWRGMVKRCTSPTCHEWPRYGGRGITVCERWMKFENFLADMGARPPGTSLDRIDGAKGYEPSNCRWATQLEQNLNKDSIRWVVFKGERVSLKEASRRAGINYATVQCRINRGMSAEDALLTPLQRGKKIAGGTK